MKRIGLLVLGFSLGFMVSCGPYRFMHTGPQPILALYGPSILRSRTLAIALLDAAIARTAQVLCIPIRDSHLSVPAGSYAGARIQRD